jgi:uroporphyrinogen-III synthase
MEGPTSDGIAENAVAALSARPLYPDKDRGAPIGAIPAKGAEVDTVLPCVYDAQAADIHM